MEPIETDLGKWWNDAVLPAFQQKAAELEARGMTKRQANDALVQIMLTAIRRRHQRYFDQINQRS
jgi:hypothetical protein